MRSSKAKRTFILGKEASILSTPPHQRKLDKFGTKPSPTRTDGLCHGGLFYERDHRVKTCSCTFLNKQAIVLVEYLNELDGILRGYSLHILQPL